LSPLPLRCVVAFAVRDRQLLWPLELEAGATVADALAAARRSAGYESVPWDSAPVGVFGEGCARSRTLRDGDRVEIYRPLTADPKERRRQRARQGAGSGRGSAGA
jgi:putative ubiquitin-RnfH superfamily antitoxin RatB of RatAB toxin-antitoxin module